jgi:hypothetical protein
MIVSCPECGKELRLKAEPAPGKRFRCPGCECDFAPTPDAPPSKKRDLQGSGRKSGRAQRDEDFEDEDRASRRSRGPYRDDEDGDDRSSRRSRGSHRDDDEDDDDRPSRRGRKKVRSGMHPGLLWGLIGGGVLLIGGGVVLVLLLVLGGSAHESAINEGISLLGELAGILESVKDSASAKAAAPGIDRVRDRLEAWNKRIKELPKPSPEEQRRLEKQFQSKQNEITQRFVRAINQARALCQGEPTFTNALGRLGGMRLP